MWQKRRALRQSLPTSTPKTKVKFDKNVERFLDLGMARWQVRSELVLARLPETPTPSKWTKLRSALTFVVGTLNLGGKKHFRGVRMSNAWSLDFAPTP